MVALPGAIHQSQPTAELKGTPLSACFIGGCTGGSIEDLRTAAAILKGKRIPINMRLSIGPQTNEVYKQAISEGLIQTFIDSGAQILSTGCASCVTTSKVLSLKAKRCYLLVAGITRDATAQRTRWFTWLPQSPLPTPR